MVENRQAKTDALCVKPHAFSPDRILARHIAIPPGDEQGLLEATRFIDAKECQTVIVAARDTVGRSPWEICDAVDRAGEMFRAAMCEKFGSQK